jgi:FdhD protein
VSEVSNVHDPDEPLPGRRRVDNTTEPVRAVEAVRIVTDGSPPGGETTDVVVESPLTIVVEDIGSFTLMCTPSDVEALAVGFALASGLVRGAGDISELSTARDPLAIHMRLQRQDGASPRRDLLRTDSSVLPRPRAIEDLLADIPRVPDTLRVPGSMLVTVARKMQAAQKLFTRTGGTHAAGIFSPDGELVVLGEDIGRHNALDKAIGKRLLDGQSPRGCGAVLSGRVSLELVAKAARAGIELLAAVSAPSSLALDAAKRCNITLCGFVRDTRATVYTHHRRVLGLDE